MDSKVGFSNIYLPGLSIRAGSPPKLLASIKALFNQLLSSLSTITANKKYAPRNKIVKHPFPWFVQNYLGKNQGLFKALVNHGFPVLNDIERIF